jgi:serine/threonine protein kinase
MSVFVDEKYRSLLFSDDKDFFTVNEDIDISKNECINSISQNKLMFMGSYAKIYKVNNTHLIKVYNESIVNFLDTITELFILTNLSHVNLLASKLVTKHNNSIVFLIPKSSQTLDNVLPNNIEEKESIMKQLLSGVNYLHSKSFLHLDLVPRNILVDIINDKFKITICDFSLSVLCQDENYISKHAKISSDHRPYENLCGSKIYRKKSDIWSLGVIFYRILKGKKLFNFSIVPREKRREFHFELSTRFEIEKYYNWKLWPPIDDSRVCRMLDLNIDTRISTSELCLLFDAENISISPIEKRSAILISKWNVINNLFVNQNYDNIIFQVEKIYHDVMEYFRSINKQLTNEEQNKIFIICYTIINSMRYSPDCFFTKKHSVLFDEIFEILCVIKGNFLKYS